MDKTIISISGYGATGSSAVVDLLKGHPDIDVLDDFEFQLHYFPDAISDLDYKLNESCSRFYDSDLAIKRFLELSSRLDDWYFPAFSGHLHEYAEEYINELNPVTWEGYWAYDRLMTSKEHIEAINKENQSTIKRNARVHFINRILRKLHLPKLNEHQPLKDCFAERKMYMSIKPKNFIEATQNFTAKLLGVASKADKPFIAVNQLLPPQNPIRFFKYFPYKVKAIIVRRDPRDLWIHIKRLNQSHYLPHYSVNEYINWYKESMLPEHNICSSAVLRLSFEDMVYNEFETKCKIYNFIGIQYEQENSTFDSHRSVINTQLFRRFPEYFEDIKEIESELSEFLYDFAKWPSVASYSGINQF